MDPDQRYCLGCRRTLAEIAAWGTLTEEEQRALLAELPHRGNKPGTKIAE